MQNNSPADLIGIKRIFFRNLSICRDVYNNLLPKLSRNFSNIPPNRLDARANIPEPFQAFKDILEVTAPEYNLEGIYPTQEDVLQSDLESFKLYSKFDSTFPKDLDRILLCCIASAYDLGLHKSTSYGFISTDDALHSFSSDTNSGYPTYTKKGTPESLDYAREFINSFINNPQYSKILSVPTTVFHRYQPKFKNTLVVKIRQVWALAFTALGLEAIAFRHTVLSVKDYVYNLKYPTTTYGRTLVQVSNDVISNFRSTGRLVSSFDVEKFDQNVPLFVIVLFFSTMEYYRPQCSRKQTKLLQCIMLYFIFTPYFYGTSQRRHQCRGIPSGSLLTSLCDTFVSRMVMNYAFYRFTRTFAGHRSCVLGDDNIVLHDVLTFDQIVYAYKVFKLPLGIDSCVTYSSRDSYDFIGYKWDVCNRPTQDLQWYLVHFVYPQRWYKAVIPISLLQTYRAISIAAPLHNGMSIFYKYLGRYDKIYQILLQRMKSGRNVFIRYIGEDSRYMYMKIPLREILTKGWRYYDSYFAI